MQFILFKMLLFLWQLNPEAFTFKENTSALMHVAENIQQRDEFLSTLVANSDHEAAARINCEFNLSENKYYTGGKMMVTKCLI